MSHEHGIMDAIATHPAGATIATVTATSGIANWFDLIGDVLGIIAVCASMAVSYIIFKKHSYELKRMKAEDTEDQK